MNIQSLSIVVPTGECWNNCEFCVSKMHYESYGKSIIINNEIPQSYINRMEFVRDEGCNSMIITGTAEPQQNMPFIYNLLEVNKHLRKPFYNISIQTTGSGFTPVMFEDLSSYGLTTLALSLASVSDERHWEITNTLPIKRTMKIYEIIDCAKSYNLNVRACFNLTDEFNNFTPDFYFNWCRSHHIDQATFRKIYTDGDNPQTKWIKEHSFSQARFNKIISYVKEEGIPIARLPYGFIQYSVDGISTVIDDNCMDVKTEDNLEEIKYAILRPNGHLYSAWNDTGSLIF